MQMVVSVSRPQASVDVRSCDLERYRKKQKKTHDICSLAHITNVLCNSNSGAVPRLNETSLPEPTPMLH